MSFYVIVEVHRYEQQMHGILGILNVNVIMRQLTIYLRGRHMSRHSRPILQLIGMQSLVRYGADVTLLSTVAT